MTDNNLEYRYRSAFGRSEQQLEGLPFEARPLCWPLLVSLIVLEIVGVSAFLWAVL